MAVFGLFVIAVIIISFIIGLVLIILGIVLARVTRKKILYLLLIPGIMFSMPFVFFGGAFGLYMISSTVERHKQIGPFFTAIEKGNYDKVKRLIKEGADINNYNENKDSLTPLILSVKKENVKIAKLLIENGADVNFACQDTTALFEAIVKNNFEIVKLFIEAGADAELKSCKRNLNALEFASIYCENPEIIELLSKKSRDINSRDDSGNFPLKNLLIKRKGYSSTVDPVLTRSIDFDRIKSAEILLKYNADMNLQDNDGNTILHDAVYDNDFEIVEFLVSKKADLNLKNKDGRTALMTGTMHREQYPDGYEKQERIIKLLIDSGSRINYIDREGLTIMDYISNETFPQDFVEYMKSKGAKRSAGLKR